LKSDTISTGKADFETSPFSILKEFEKNDSLANKKYLGKSIKIGSHVVEVSGDSAILLKLDGGIEGATINCGFDKSQKDKLGGIVAGDSVIVQCSCGGYTKPESADDLLSEKYLELNICNLLLHVPVKPKIGTDIESPKSDTANKQ
jgi:hypothetical protein